MNLRGRCTAGLVVLLSSIPLQAQIEYRVRSEEQIEGRSAAGDVEFSSLAETQDLVVVSFVVQDSTEIRANIDYAREEVKVRASSLGSSRPISLSPSDRTALAHLTAIGTSPAATMARRSGWSPAIPMATWTIAAVPLPIRGLPTAAIRPAALGKMEAAAAPARGRWCGTREASSSPSPTTGGTR
jgi:hypothetical protein